MAAGNELLHELGRSSFTQAGCDGFSPSMMTSLGVAEEHERLYAAIAVRDVNRVEDLAMLHGRVSRAASARLLQA